MFILLMLMYERTLVSYIFHDKRDINKVLDKPSIDINKYEYGLCDDFGIYDEEIIKFCNKLIDNFDKNDLKLLYNNINKLKFNPNKRTLYAKLTKSLGYYDANKNEIVLSRDHDFGTIDHELFHMSSAYKDNNNIYCGFSQQKKLSYGFGAAINEGYTEKMTHQYFDKEGYSYIFEYDVVRRLEKIIGKTNMQKYYLNANLKGLILELSKYSSLDETLEFINNMDINLCDKDKLTFFRRPLVRKQIITYLIKIYSNYLSKKLYNNEIDIKEFERLLLDYAVGINDKYFFKDVISTKYLSKIIQEALTDTLSFKNYNNVEKNMFTLRKAACIAALSLLFLGEIKDIKSSFIPQKDAIAKEINIDNNDDLSLIKILKNKTH